MEIAVPHGSVPVLPGRIVSIEACGHATSFHMEGGTELRSTLPFSEALELVAGDSRFLQINRGIAINMDHVLSVEGTTLATDDGLRFPLRKRDRSALSLAITRHMVERMGGEDRG